MFISPRSTKILTLDFLAHVTLIPLLAMYGLQICPILHGLGFSFGCVYNTVFIALNSVLSFVFFIRLPVERVSLRSHEPIWILSPHHHSHQSSLFQLPLANLPLDS